MDTSVISGLTCIENYLDPDEQARLIDAIDQQQWISDLKRRVQHYGYRYDYKARAIHAAARLGDLPEWLHQYAVRLQESGFTAAIPDQAIINEYYPGQGIAPHIDCIPCFSDTIFSISLNSSCVMQFSSIIESLNIQVVLRPGSLIIMRGEARYKWKHGIAPRKTDIVMDETIRRGRRISVTFRKVIE